MVSDVVSDVDALVCCCKGVMMCASRDKRLVRSVFTASRVSMGRRLRTYCNSVSTTVADTTDDEDVLLLMLLFCHAGNAAAESNRRNKS